MHGLTYITSIIKCTNVKNGRALFNEGSILFGTPKKWVNEAIKKEKEGRGDLLEGVFSASRFPTNACRYYSDVQPYYSKKYDLTYFRRKLTMELPCYCFYITKIDDFRLNTEESRTYSLDISKNFFEDFADYKTENDLLIKTDENLPAIVWITNTTEFINRIVNFLIKMGVSPHEILYEEIKHIDMTKEFDFFGKIPPAYELTYKDNKFAHQSEGRIIINTDKKDILDELHRNPIQIGSIADIAQFIDNYFYFGARLTWTPEE